MKWLKRRVWLWLAGLLAPVITWAIILLSVVSVAMSLNNQNSSNDVGGDIEISELGEKDIPAQYIPIYKEAGKKYDIAWTLIAAFHKVETNFGTHPSMVSSAGALGHFQFLPETWLGWGYGSNPPKSVYENPAMIKKYGGYGVDADGNGKADPYNIKDSAFACANYVSASGGMNNLRKAIFAYNHADWYVDKVLGYYNAYSKGDYRPVNGGGVSGGHGKGKYKYPIPEPIVVTSPYGYRDWSIAGGGEFHNGIDFAGNSSTPILATMDGTVVHASMIASYGNCTVIQHPNGKYSLYAHQSSIGVRVGQKVKVGQQIGLMGTTGDSTGVHLHFCITDGLFTGYQDPKPLLGL
ncbi:peptidoglycan DD-metalloendopeptidase family protein [uncultured Vagococcus sp.]|uniref:peptidoglycan DD-metalloendopeptidase family protein n=1 Tax=uncultured Vagococcus sp. TaxID=189676 RepID=UPI002590D039|nr:peptidoglycan DD-metalloendopeptidase family protein [uncultured Vagococcus sp.]